METKTVFAAGVLTLFMLAMNAAAAQDTSDDGKTKDGVKKIWGLEKMVFVHYDKAKNNNNAKPQKTTTCYKLLRYTWNTLPVNYVINPGNAQAGLSEGFIVDAISSSAETWDEATIQNLFSSPEVDYEADYGIQDYTNAVAFGDYPDSNVIAVTSIWATRVGKRIVEFDMLFDTDYVWGDATSNTGLMDLQNIATHELGHAAGLADLYTSSCTEVTMYGYSGYGETKKRSLEQPDITGLQTMYGA